jgi:hypothetical protein
MEYLYGGPLPRIAEGAVGDLVLDAIFLEDEEEVERLTEKRRVPLLPRGARVMVLLNPDPPAPERLRLLIERPDEMRWMVNGSHVAEVELKETLFLDFRGAKPARLSPVRCGVVALKREARSLNHAYTLLSAFFERKRRSHTGNVFELVAYRDPGKPKWPLLGELRDQKMALYEERLRNLRGGVGEPER